MRGNLFENLVVTEFIKEALNRGEEPGLSFWRDKTGNEVDLLLTRGNQVHAFEIKSGETYTADYFKGISYWSKLSGATGEICSVIYNGDTLFRTSKGDVIPWSNFDIPQ